MAAKSGSRADRKRRGALQADPAGQSVRLEIRLPRDVVKLLDVARALDEQTRHQWIEAAIRERTAGLVVQIRQPAPRQGEAAA